jgi:hypothetical protein
VDDPREAMLRPEFRDWYPSLTPDRWYSARQLADIVLEQRRTGEPHWELEERVPPDEHFLFRGGRARGQSPSRTRRSDQPPGAHPPESPAPGPGQDTRRS